MEINWTLITYIIVGFFALSGLFKGWWKEAILAFFLAILVFLLDMPDVAQQAIDLFNAGLIFLWGFLPDSFIATLVNFLETGLGIKTNGNVFQLDSGSGETWLIILLVFIGLGIFISRATLPNKPGWGQSFYAYPVTMIGSVVGSFIGGLNGFLIVSLIREYLDGRNLPPGAELVTEIAMTGGNIGTVSSGVAIQATELPALTIFNGVFSWIIIVLGIFFFLSVLTTLLLRRDTVPLGYVGRFIENDKDTLRAAYVLGIPSFLTIRRWRSKQ